MRRKHYMFICIFCCGEYFKHKHTAHFFSSESAANGWRHNKRYYLIYTYRFCRKCEQLKKHEKSQFVSHLLEKNDHFQLETWRCKQSFLRHSEAFLQKTQDHDCCVCTNTMHWWFWEYGHCRYKSRCSKWPMCLFWFELDIHRQDQILQFPNSRDVCLSKFGMEGNPDTFFFGISLKRYLHIAPLSEQKNAVKFSHGGEAMGCGVSAFKKYAASEVAKNTVRSCLHISCWTHPVQ